MSTDEVEVRLNKLIQAMNDMSDAACRPRIADRMSEDDFEVWKDHFRSKIEKELQSETKNLSER